MMDSKIKRHCDYWNKEVSLKDCIRCSTACIQNPSNYQASIHSADMIRRWPYESRFNHAPNEMRGEDKPEKGRALGLDLGNESGLS